MGTVNTEIKLINSDDLVRARIGNIKPEQVRTTTVTAVVDTGAMYPVLTEELRDKLGLAIKKDGTAHIANGKSIPCQITEAKVELLQRRHPCGCLFFSCLFVKFTSTKLLGEKNAYCAAGL